LGNLSAEVGLKATPKMETYNSKNGKKSGYQVETTSKNGVVGCFFL
jgi:hypothetical protein